MIRYSILELSDIKLGWTNIFEFFEIMGIVQVKALFELNMFLLTNRNDIKYKK